MATQGYEEELLQRWFPTTEPRAEPKQFAETDISKISTILERAERVAWSRIPRIYIVLRLINELGLIDDFLRQEISDTWLPFTQHSLPDVIRSQARRTEFLHAQRLVYNSKALDLERGRHGHFHDASDVPLKKIGDLGKGGSGFVERVISTITYKEYALKLIKRGQTFRKDKKVLRDFEKELSNLRKVSQAHRHIIDLIGSYTEPKYVGILFPVADCDLGEFLERADLEDRRWTLRGYFGCLASALTFIHDNNMRHKDIKPQNILVKDNEPYFTDFGLAVDWAEVGHSTTQGPTGMTPRYSAPEVAAYEPRNSSSDTWSLGCVFLEIYTVLKSASLKELRAFTAPEGRIFPYYSPSIKLSDIFDHIERLPGPAYDDLPLTWIKHMLQRDQQERWSMHLVSELIQENGMDPSTPYLYIGRCCLDDQDSPESVVSHVSSDEEDFIIKTGILDKKVRGTTHNNNTSLPPSSTDATLIEGKMQAKSSLPDKSDELEFGSQISDPDQIHPNRVVFTIKKPQGEKDDEEEEEVDEAGSHLSLPNNSNPLKGNKTTTYYRAPSNPAEDSSKDHAPRRPTPYAFTRQVDNLVPKPYTSSHDDVPRIPSPSLSMVAASSIEESSDEESALRSDVPPSRHRIRPEARKRAKAPAQKPAGSGFVGVMKSLFIDPTKDKRRGTARRSEVHTPSKLGAERAPSGVKEAHGVECIVCMNDDLPVRKITKLACGHHMCDSCLKRQFTLSVQDPAHMPPRCCTSKAIPFEYADRLLDDEFKTLYAKKFLECLTSNRLYCPSKGCGQWIKPSRIRTDLTYGRVYARCGTCSTKVCVLCNERFHTKRDCPKDEETNRMVEMAKEQGWQRCYNCKAVAELKDSWNRMTCRCTAQFCMVCAAPWKTCNCPWFNYQHIDDNDRVNDMRVPHTARRQEYITSTKLYSRERDVSEEEAQFSTQEQRRRQEVGARPKAKGRRQRDYDSLEDESSADEKARYEAGYRRRQAEDDARRKEEDNARHKEDDEVRQRAAEARPKAKGRRQRDYDSVEDESSAGRRKGAPRSRLSEAPSRR